MNDPSACIGMTSKLYSIFDGVGISRLKVEQSCNDDVIKINL